MMTVKEKQGKKRLQVIIDQDLYDDVGGVLEALGLNPTTLVTALYKRVAAEGGLPFSLKMTPEEKAKHDLLVASNKVPVEKIDTPEKLETWFNEHE